MPLAIDLAAAWVRALSCHDIAAELRRSFDFLSIPDPHEETMPQTMRAVFESSWRRLDEKARCALARLSVFRAGFDRDAASAVARADAAILADLIDRSLIRVLPEDRYDLHDIIAHYAAAKLVENGDARDAQQALLNYYVLMLGQRQDQRDPTQMLKTFLWLCREHANLEAALDWASSGDSPGDLAAVRLLTESLHRERHRWGVHLLRAT
jgi:predicted ATPase